MENHLRTADVTLKLRTQIWGGWRCSEIATKRFFIQVTEIDRLFSLIRQVIQFTIHVLR